MARCADQLSMRGTCMLMRHVAHGMYVNDVQNQAKECMACRWLAMRKVTCGLRKLSKTKKKKRRAREAANLSRDVGEYRSEPL